MIYKQIPAKSNVAITTNQTTVNSEESIFTEQVYKISTKMWFNKARHTATNSSTELLFVHSAGFGLLFLKPF